MADFAPQVPLKEPQEYLRLSQGWSDRSGAALFQGLGDVMKLGVTAVDERNKREIKDELRTRVDETQDRSIAELHSLTRDPTKVPPEILRSADKLRKYKEAVNQGSFRESNYWGALDATARQLRAKYPGYRDHIDQTMKEFTGSDPANAVIRELRQDAAAAMKTDDLTKRRLSLLEDYNKKFGGLPPNWQNMGYEQIMELWSGEQRKAFALDQRKSQLTLAEQQGKFDRSTAAELASGEWGTIFNRARQGSESVFAQSVRDIEKIRDSVTARGGFNPTAEETKQYVERIDAATRDLTTQFQNFLTEPRAHLGNKSYAMVLNKQQIEELKANQLDLIVTDMKQATFDKDLGFAKRASLLAETYSDTEKVRLLGFDIMRKLAASRQILGDVGNSVMLQGKTLGEVQEILRQNAVTSMGDVNNPTSLQKQVQLIKDKGEAKPEVVQEVIASNVRMITNKEISPSVRGAMIDSMYGEGNETFLGMVNRDPKLGGSRSSPQRVFQMMANSRTAEAVWNLSQETKDPTHWNKYERWVTSQVYALNTLDFNTVARAQGNAPGMDIRFDPQTMSFSVTETDQPFIPSQTPGMAALRGLANAYEGSRVSSIQTAVLRLNESMAPLRDIAEKKGVDRTTYALAVLQGIGVRAESRDGRESVAQSLLTTLSNYLYHRPEVKKPKGYVQPGPEAELFPNATRFLTKPTGDTRTTGEILRQSPIARGLSWLDETIRSTLPTRSGIDRARNQGRMDRQQQQEDPR